MSLLGKLGEQFFGPVHYSNKCFSELTAQVWGDVELRVQGEDRVVYLRSGDGNARRWSVLSVETARRIAAELLEAAQVAERLPSKGQG